MYSGYNIYEHRRQPNDGGIEQPCQAYLDQEIYWEVIEDLLTGSQGIRAKHRKYLPQMEREDERSYDRRLSRSVCPPYYERIEKLLAGMLIRKPIRTNDVPPRITEDLFDIDMQNNGLSVWAYTCARTILRYGHAGVLVEADKNGGRPYWVTYSPREILGWRSEIIDGARKFTQLRLLEKVVEPDGEYSETTVEQVRLLTPGAFEIHRRNKQGEFTLHEEGTTSLSEIPFAVAYSNRVNFMESRPPLGDVAQLNILSYQNGSDVSNQLHISAVPMLAFFGFPQSAEEVSAGPSEALSLPTDSDARFIEPEGKSFDAQFTQLDRIEKQINELGMAAILGTKLKNVGESSKAKEIDRSQGDSTMKVVAQQLQDLIDNCLMYHAKYLNLSQSGNCFVNRDFLGSRLDPQEINSLKELWTSGAITQETLLKQLEAGEVLGDDFEIEEELLAVQQEGLSAMEAEAPILEANENEDEESAEPEDVDQED